MKYSVVNNIHIAEVPVRDFKLVLYDGYKKSIGKNRCNAGFFGTFHEKKKDNPEKKQAFTLPAGHLVCDYAATEEWTHYYCKERGKFNGKKFTFDSGNWAYQNQFYGKAQTTLIIKSGKATMQDLDHAPAADYAIAGVPIMRGGDDVTYNTYVKGQGWGSGSLYGTWHIFVGIKAASADTVYVMGMKTTSANMITSAEAYKKFKPLGFCDVIKLDGGGSFYFNVDGKVTQTSENRRVCSIIDLGVLEQETKNPYPIPTVTLRRGNIHRNANRWLQWELTAHGFACDVDGYFGADTYAKVCAFQKAKGLVVDGVVGKNTRTAILTK